MAYKLKNKKKKLEEPTRPKYPFLADLTIRAGRETKENFLIAEHPFREKQIKKLSDEELEKHYHYALHKKHNFFNGWKW